MTEELDQLVSPIALYPDPPQVALAGVDAFLEPGSPFSYNLNVTLESVAPRCRCHPPTDELPGPEPQRGGLRQGAARGEQPMRGSTAAPILPVFAIAALLALAGCAGNIPSRYYFLSSLPEAGGAGSASTPEQGVAVGIGPVRIPDYLNRPQIVTRTGPNEFQLAEFNQWGGPLEAEVSRVLAENLSVLLPGYRVAIFPWNMPYPAQYRVQVAVVRFEGDASGEVGLVARWSIVGKDGKLLRTVQSSLREAAGRQDYEAIVAAMSRALAGLSREIASALQALPSA